MTPALRTIIAIALTTFLCTGPIACKPKAAGTSILTTTVGGRQIRGVIDGSASIHPGADSATISFAGHKVTVKQAAVLLDGAELAKIPAAATIVAVIVLAGQLTVTADGASVAVRQLGK